MKICDKTVSPAPEAAKMAALPGGSGNGHDPQLRLFASQRAKMRMADARRHIMDKPLGSCHDDSGDA